MRLAILVLAVACSRAEPPGADPPLPGVAVVDAALTERLAAATARHGAPYHTRNLAPGGAPKFTNRLILETSPYLLQHAHNPMSWYAWGDEPFARAKREGKLVLLSIGYSTCHWCHVMEADSFEDEEVARYVNANYIAIKVDREERPDLDALYMQALVALTGSGGWPMTIVTDGDRRPVFGGTFMPKQRLLATLAQIRATDPAQLADVALRLTQALAHDDPRTGAATLPGPDAIVRGARALAAEFDPVHAGFGRGHKFPSVPDLELLLRYQRRTRDPVALDMVTRTLDAMTAGGIHDHLGGGFHRYATDRPWLVPHFEKMIYDNAQLAIVYTEAAQITGRDDLGAIARETLDYMLREMASPDGGFYSATDADSAAPDGAMLEGYYFTWTAAEAGIPLDDAVVGARHVIHGAPLDADIRARLLAIRARRTPPARDDKILASWNGLAISALAKAGFAFDRPAYLRAAERCATFVTTALAEGGGLRRSFVGGEARQRGTLDDYAFVIAGLLDLFEATSDHRWLDKALALGNELESRFADPAGGYFRTDAAGEQLWTREKPSEDGAEPSGNAIAIGDLLRLGELTGDAAWRTRAEHALAAFDMSRDGGSPGLRAALDEALDMPAEIAIVAPHDLAAAAALVAEVRKVYQPGRTLVMMSDDAPVITALTDGKHALGGAPTAFVCEATRCKQPTSDPAVLATQLAQIRPLLPDRSPTPLVIPPR